ncbi:hypothetical protein LXL04_010344 [Taraxacum kok-saghyz]
MSSAQAFFPFSYYVSFETLALFDLLPCAWADERLHCNPKAQWLSEPSDLHLSFSSELLSYHLCAQIRTEEMDLIAERGIAAHYSGKVIIKILPKGATVIDYGYMIHTDIGNNMVAAKVNGNIVPFSILHTKSSRRYYRISN